MDRPTIVVTRKLPSAVEDDIAAHFDAHFNVNDVAMTAEQLSDAMQRADGLLCTVADRITAQHFAVAGRRARIVANFGVGVNNIDLVAARSSGTVVTNTPNVVTDDTADATLALILMTMRRFGEGERHVRAGAWTGLRPTHMLGRSLRDKVLGIIGYGRIGRAVARRAALAFGMPVLWYAPRDPVVTDKATGGPPDAERVATLEELLRRADVVSLHCPALPETRHLIGTPQLALMKRTAVLINTARGDVVDERALVTALTDGAIAGAGLDVFEFEPAIPPELNAFEQVVLLPHLGSATIETRSAMGQLAFNNLKAFFADEAPPNRVA